MFVCKKFICIYILYVEGIIVMEIRVDLCIAKINSFENKQKSPKFACSWVMKVDTNLHKNKQWYVYFTSF